MAGPIEVFGAALGGAHHEFGSITPTDWRRPAGRGAAAGLDWYFAGHFSAQVQTGVETENIRVSGSQQGRFHIIPTSALVQYHPVTDSIVEPYVGVGVAYLMFRGGVTTPYGRAEQPDHAALMTDAGINYVVARHWRVSIGAEYGLARSTAEIVHPGAKTDKVDYHQLYIATGLRYRF